MVIIAGSRIITRVGFVTSKIAWYLLGLGQNGYHPSISTFNEPDDEENLYDKVITGQE